MIYQSRYENEFASSKKYKNKKIGKIRKHCHLNVSHDEENNFISNFRDNNAQDINNVNNMFLNKYDNYLVSNSIQIEKLDNNINNKKKTESLIHEKNEIISQNENLNNEENNKNAKIKKKEKKSKEKSRSRDKSKDKSKLKFKTIDSFFNNK